MPQKTLSPNKNKIYFFILAFLLTALIAYNLFNIQVVKGRYYYFTSQNSFHSSILVRASRGLIYDRNGVKLVDNELKYNLYISKENAKQKYLDTSLENLEKLFNEDVKAKYQKEDEKLAAFPQIAEIKLYSRLDYNPYIFQIEANPDKYPLVKIEKTNVRKYYYPELISHIVGYTSEITAEDYATNKYDYGDDIGKTGIEKGYDEILRGKNGLERIDINLAQNKRVVSSIVDKVNGNDIYLSIDINYQKKLYDATKTAFDNKRLEEAVSSGSVIEDVKTGEILAMVSYPTFDSNLFVKGLTDTEYKKYIDNPGKPLINKVTQYSQPSGSILKPLVDAVYLQEGVINRTTKIETGGTWNYGGVVFQDFNKNNYGNLDVVGAICKSSNLFHQRTALTLEAKTNGKTADLIADSFDKLGINKVSSLKISPEAIGYFPRPSEKRANGELWRTGDLFNAVIGQGDVRMTPLGAATMVTSLANKGKVNRQTIIKKQDNNEIKLAQLDSNEKNFDIIHEGMKCAGDTISKSNNYDLKKYPGVSVKTGTAQTGQIRNGEEVIHGWEISFAPSDKPEIAMSVFVENGGKGSNIGTVSREFYRGWAEELRKK